jgi:hypothetical protein
MNEETIDRIDVMLTHHGESGAAGLAPGPTGPTAAGDLEEEYQKIGRWKGPFATPEAQARVRDFWSGQGEPGLHWLVGRFRQEWHIDVLDGVANLLAETGEAAVPTILEELERQPAVEHAEALLKALAWIGENGVNAPSSLTTRLEAILTLYLQSDDPGPREWAARSACLLPQQQAIALLRHRHESESDAGVRRAIEDVIDVDTTARD